MLKEFLPLQDLTVFFQYWNVKLCLFMHCIWAANQAPEIKDHFLLHYWVCFLSGFSGALTTSILIMNPSLSPPPMLNNSADALMWTLTWLVQVICCGLKGDSCIRWAINHFPFDLARKLVKLKACWIVVLAGSAFCRASIIVAKVDYAVEYLPQNTMAPIILGTIASMAGKPISQIILSILNVDHSPNEMLSPTFVWWSGFMCTCLYYTSAHVLKIMTPSQAWALNCGILVLHAILSGMTNWQLDFTFLFRRAIYTIGNLHQSKVELATSSVEDPSSSGAVNGTKESKKQR
eukprot:g5755.t1